MARDPLIPPSPRSETRLLVAAFWLLLALQIALPWLAYWFPAQDGPSALYGGHLLNHLLARDSYLYSSFYQINHRPDPYWISQAALALLLRLAPTPPAAEKLFVSLNVLAYGVGLVLLSRQLSKERLKPDGETNRPAPLTSLAPLLALPLALSWPLHMGFYNYTLGFALGPWLMAAWLAWRRKPNWLPGLALAALGVIVFLTHLVAWVMCFAAAEAINLLTLIAATRLKRDSAPPKSAAPRVFRSAANYLIVITLPWLPACAMAAFFAAHAPPPFPGEPLLYFSFSKLTALLTLDDALVSYGTAERFAALALVAAILVLAAGAFRSPSRRAFPAAAAIAAIWLAVYLVAPSAAGGAYYIHRRLLLYPVLGAAFWLGAAPAPPRFRQAAAALAIAAALTQIVSLAVSYRALVPRQRAFAAALAELPADRVMMPISLTPLGVASDGITPFFDRVRPFAHAASYLAIARNDVDLGDFMTTWEYAPVYSRPLFNVRYSNVGDFYYPSRIHPTAWERHAGRPIDVVLLYDATHRLLALPAMAPLRAELDAFSPPKPAPAKDFQILIRRP